MVSLPVTLERKKLELVPPLDQHVFKQLNLGLHRRLPGGKNAPLMWTGPVRMRDKTIIIGKAEVLYGTGTAHEFPLDAVTAQDRPEIDLRLNIAATNFDLAVGA